MDTVKLVLMLGDGLVYDMGVYPSAELGWETAVALYCMNGERYQVRDVEGNILHDTNTLFDEQPCDKVWPSEIDDEDYVPRDDSDEEEAGDDFYA